LIILEIPQYAIVIIINIKYICVVSAMDLHKAREIFQADGYGRFDGIEQLLDRSEILTARPRMLRKKVAALLGIRFGELNNKTFMSWLYRARKRLNESPIPVFQPPFPMREPGAIDQGGEDVSADWREFKASDPKRIEEVPEAAIRFPEYNDPS
jgi:hypothetical protein